MLLEKKPTPVDSKIRKSVTPVKENNVRSSPFVDKSNHEVYFSHIYYIFKELSKENSRNIEKWKNVLPLFCIALSMHLH
jgi:hypothetical protein